MRRWAGFARVGVFVLAVALAFSSAPVISFSGDHGPETDHDPAAPVEVFPYELPAGMCRPITIDDVLAAEALVEPDLAEETELAEEAAAPAAECDTYTYPMVFPVDGWAWISSPFGALRAGGARRHLGVDVMADKMARVVAVADGVVAWIADGTDDTWCCSIQITHEDGWHSVYIHLNNDTSGTDDGLGTGIALGLQPGDPVVAGQVIGYVGDSGNAEPTPPHLHFELHRPDGVPVDAAASLLAALGVVPRTDPMTGMSTLFAATTGSAPSGAFRDDDGLASARWIDLLASRGLVGACDEAGADFCPNDALSAARALLWLERAGMTVTSIDYGSGSSSLVALVERAWSSGTASSHGLGCGTHRLCADDSITIGEALALIAEAFDLEPTHRTQLHHDRDSVFAASIRAAVNAGVVDLCAAPAATTLAPDRPATRAWFAAILARALTEVAPQECSSLE